MTLNYNDKCRKPDRISESFDIIAAGILLIEKKTKLDMTTCYCV